MAVVVKGESRGESSGPPPCLQGVVGYTALSIHKLKLVHWFWQMLLLLSCYEILSSLKRGQLATLYQTRDKAVYRQTCNLHKLKTSVEMLALLDMGIG